ncbi:MAG: Leucine-rich repeat (LRR) protein [Bacillariaceae sp.]|jgi:Leucine-rich repeat (LRR) protein
MEDIICKNQMMTMTTTTTTRRRTTTTTTSTFLVGLFVILLCQHQQQFVAEAQSDGVNIWSDNSSQNTDNNFFGRDDTSPEVAKKILSDLYSATGGLDWNDSSNWVQQGTDICNWKGISCYEDNGFSGGDTRREGQIKEINLSHNNLGGTLPPNIFDLPYLESFNVEDNPDLHIDLSGGLSKAQFLKFLTLSKTQVSNLNGIGDAKSLEELHIADMKLGGTIHPSIFNLRTLKVLHANDNSFSGPLPPTIGQLTNMEELYLYDNELTGQIPLELGRLSLMQILTLTNNAFSGSLPAQVFDQMTNLRTLAIQRLPTSDGNMNSMKGSGISGSIPAFRSHRRLTKLQLENQRFNGSLDSDFLLSSPTGESVEVDLRGNDVTGLVPSTLADKRFLSLYLADNQITTVPSQIFDTSFGTCTDINDWMSGDVARLGCQAFLCPPGTWAPQGRTTSDSSCQACGDDSSHWGRTKCQSSTSSTTQQREILLSFYNALGGRNWKVDEGWLELNGDVCRWHGIGCDSSTGQVTSIILRNNGLSGMVPSDLFNLPSLQILNLESNTIEFDFASVNDAASLQSLDLTATGLRSLNGLETLSPLPNLKFLSLASNRFEGIIPNAMYQLTRLEDINLSYNDFTGTLSSRIGDMTNLKRFACDGTQLTGQLPAEIGNLVNVEEFSAAENEFTGTLPNTLNALINLQTLNLQQVTGNGAGIGGSLLPFTNSGQLKTLYLDSNQLTGSLPSNFLVNSRYLQTRIDIGLSDNQFQGIIPDSWSRFDQLFVDLAGNKISGISSSLCSMAGWMKGAVSEFQCDAILCPAGTYNTFGRKTDNASTCLDCPGSASMGATFCGEEGTKDVSSEINILLDIFSETGGNGWKNNDGWDTSTDYCDRFYGVECDGAGRVTVLDLSNNDLKGAVPASVFKLKFLRELTLSGNPVELTFEGIGEADKLINLILDNTNVNSVDGIGDSKNIQILNLAGNDLKGSIPLDLYLMTSIKKLDLGYNLFSGRLNNVIGAMTSLESLHLYHNQFTGRIPAAIGDLVNLQELNLAENNFDGTIPAQLNDLTNLKFLSIQREGGISGTTDVGINQGKSSLQGIGLTGPLPAFEKLKYITELYLGVNGLTGDVPFNFLDGVENKAAQIKVDITSNMLTGTLPASMTQFDNMSLYAAGNRFTGIADGICDKSQWLNGDVNSYQCGGILCPVGTYNEIGRASSSASCQTCSSGTNGYLGSFDCLSSADAQEGSEREILEKLYYAMDGPNWIDNTNWLDPDESICNWFGIQCDSSTVKSVSSIDLSYNRLSNEFPSQTYKLPSLKELNLQGNAITFTFNGIRNAVNLESLDLEDTGLTSLFGIGQATNLKLLRVDSNNFGSFPDEVFDIPALEVLSLSSNLFVFQQIPSNLQIFTSMTYFSCSGCGFMGPIPVWFSSMQNLQYLKLSQNALTGTLPSDLELILTLKHLDLSDQATLGRGISGSLLPFAAQTDLTELYLQHNSFEGAIPDTFLSSVRNDALVTVDLRYNRFSGTIPLNLGNIDQLNLYMASNLFETIPQSLCGNDWNDGDVAKNGCDGLLCPSGTFNAYGRATSGVECIQCDDPLTSEYLGNTFCGSALEHQALVILYRSFGGPNWTSDNNWLRSDDHCTWEGITCWTSGLFNGLVNRIVLPNNNMFGDMPFALIWQLEGLTYLDLQDNDISLPFSMIGNAINLETVILSNTKTNSLVGIGEASFLKSLHLTNAALTGSIPEELFSLSLLEELFLSHNELTGSIGPGVGQLKQLRDLYLFGNNLVGTIPPELGYLARMEHMSLGKNRLQGSIPRQITSLPLLEFLSLENEAGTPDDAFSSGTGLSGPVPALDGFPRISELYLGHNSFTGTVPSHFLQGVHDKSAKITVDLGFNAIDGSIPVDLSNFDDLNLLLVGNEISDIPAEVCKNVGWMNGEVAHGCDSILCPPGFYNMDGRQVDTTTLCETCTYPGSARHYGSTSCGPGSTDSLDDRAILFELYDAAGGDSWTTSTGWKSDSVNFCDWYGVTCAISDTGEQHVSELNLAENNLNGIVPSVIYHLEALEKLDVRKNPVSVTFKGIDQATELKEIYLDETLVKNMNGIGLAKNLQILHAYKNNFGGQSIPDELFDISTLVDLNLSGSMLIGTLSAKIGQLSNLQRITLIGNSLNGELPSQFGQLKALKELEISNNKWIGTLPSSWVGMTALEAIFLDNTDEKTSGITGSLIAFATMPNLREVHLSNNQLTGTIPSNFLSGIAQTSSLVNARLDQNHLVGTVPSSLVTFSKLNIDLTGNLITAIGAGLCDQSEWNDGNVGRYRCDGILCPAGEFSPSGRQTNVNDACQPCPGKENSSYLGDTICITLAKQREREILGMLFEATNGNNWKIKDGWMDDNSDVCTWHGIKCQDGSTVESIQLGSNHLVGSVPKEIFELPNMKSLWLYSNPVEFSFDGIGEATKLESLRLDSTKLQSLDGIGAGLSLVDVDVGFNQLSIPIPKEIENLTNLESFTGSVNGFTGPVPDFSTLRKLNTLRLSDNKLTGGLPSFSRHSELKALDLSENNLEGPVPSNFLESVDSERSLSVDLSNNKLSGTVPGDLTRITDMMIYLRDNRINGIDPSLCTKTSWNQGDVGSFQCDGILCPAGTFALSGRASRSGSSCEPCRLNQYYGGTTCGGSSASSSRPATITILILAVSTSIVAFVF